MAKLAELAVSLELQSAAFQKGVDRANKSLDRMGRETRKTNTAMGRMQKSVTGLSRGLIGIATAMASAFSARNVKNAIEFADALGKTAVAVGLTTKELQEYQFAAERGGISTGQFNSNMTAFVKRVGEAQNGMGPLVSGLKNMDAGLLQSIVAAKSQGEAFKIVANAIQNAKTATEAAAIANAAFSRSGVAMVGMLNNGAAGLDEMARKAEELGAVMDSQLIAKAEVINDRWDQMVQSIGVKLKSAIIIAVDWLNKLAGIFSDVGEAEIRLAEIQNELVESHARLATANSIMAVGLRNNIKFLEDEQKTIEDSVELLRRLDAIKKSAGNDGTQPGVINVNGVNAANTALARYEKTVLNAALATELIGDKVKILHRLMLDGRISQELYTAELEKFSQAAGVQAPEALNAMAVAAGTLAATGIKDMVDGFVEGTLSFTNLVETFLKGIAKMIVQQLIFNALAGTSFGGFLGLAAGGKVSRGGSYIVGEKGPELFSPASDGAIIPNHQLGAVGGSTTVNVNNYSAANVDVNETQASNGEKSIDIKISDMVRREIKRGGFDRQNRSVYGLNRVGY